MRYAKPEFLNTLASNTPLPMIVDADCGMPLDLAKWDSLWVEHGNDLGVSFQSLDFVCILWTDGTQRLTQIQIICRSLIPRTNSLCLNLLGPPFLTPMGKLRLARLVHHYPR
jgi:hypothetical protein